MLSEIISRSIMTSLISLFTFDELVIFIASTVVDCSQRFDLTFKKRIVSSTRSKCYDDFCS